MVQLFKCFALRHVAQSDLIWVAALYDVVYFHQVLSTATQICGNDRYRSFEEILTISDHMDKVGRCFLCQKWTETRLNQVSNRT